MTQMHARGLPLGGMRLINEAVTPASRVANISGSIVRLAHYVLKLQAWMQCTSQRYRYDDEEDCVYLGFMHTHAIIRWGSSAFSALSTMDIFNNETKKIFSSKTQSIMMVVILKSVWQIGIFFFSWGLIAQRCETKMKCSILQYNNWINRQIRWALFCNRCFVPWPHRLQNKNWRETHTVDLISVDADVL